MKSGYVATPESHCDLMSAQISYVSSESFLGRDTSFYKGILPYPKYDENQDSYYSFSFFVDMMFGIPTECPDKDFSGFMLEALSAEATDTSLKAYYDFTCKLGTPYDDENTEMLKLITSSIVYDPLNIYHINYFPFLTCLQIASAKENLFINSNFYDIISKEISEGY